ncbi:ATP-dependent RNA helicase HrpA [Jatrophihabitans sp. YIM 134969]
MSEARPAADRRRRPRRPNRPAPDTAGATRRREARLAARPAVLTFPPELPVSARREEIAAAIRDHQVVVVAGETGSGKTTQLPKICLELGRGVDGVIGHTQPRRIAARTVAERIASELGTPLGETVGYAVRFTDRVSDSTSVKVMTDGILLAEIARDRDLRRYDTLIIDEAHERSLTIDFLLGYLVRLLPRRPDLKVVITSATIDPQRFSAHFGGSRGVNGGVTRDVNGGGSRDVNGADAAGVGAPIVEVSGRTFPVEVRYRPLEYVADADEVGDDPTDAREPRDQTEGVIAAVRELTAEGPGDILVFLSGEREIRDTADALEALDLRDTDVLPLYARLSTAEQHKVFAPHTRRHVVLATNVAETSITVPGVHYVVDPGTARISRYSNRTKVQRLPVEPISQASANQRSGRCGRVADGIAIRLYSEADFAARPEFTEPEILRTNLAAVVLQMAALRLGDIEAFPFLDPPDRRSIRDAHALLFELGALQDATTDQPALTDVGRTMARLPVDPRWARMIVEADRQGCLREVLVIAAALSIPDVRERPLEQRPQADQAHARFADDDSDFTTLLNLWRYLREQQQALSGNAFRRMCRSEFLHYLRVREWQDLVGQLRAAARGAGMQTADQEASSGAVLTAVTAGLLGHVGARQGDTRDFVGARGARFVIAPGSRLTSRPPRWVVAGELVETSRLFARTVARVDPVLVEKLAGHLVTRTYSEPHWNAERGNVQGYERVTLYGLVLAPRRRVDYGRIDPPVARELFIRHALVQGEWRTHHRFWERNQAVRDEVAELEDRLRRRDLAVDDEAIFAFYDARVPADVVSVRHFDRWWKTADQHQLDLTREQLLAAEADLEDRPREWTVGDVSLPLTYRFDPGALDDGVTVHVPADVVGSLPSTTFDWQVPALRHDLVTALVRGLPKDVRRQLGPAPNVATAALARMDPADGPLVDQLQRAIHADTGVLVPLADFRPDRLPPHLRVTVVVEQAGEVVARGDDLEALQEKTAAPVRREVGAAVLDRLGRGVRTSFDLDELPRTVEEHSAGHDVVLFPALTLVDGGVGVAVCATAYEQQQAMAAATRWLLRQTLPSPVRTVVRGLDPRTTMLLGATPDGTLTELVQDACDCALDELVRVAGGPAWSRAEFEALTARIGAHLVATTRDAALRAVPLVEAAWAVQTLVRADRPAPQRPAVEQVRAQLIRLVKPPFLTRTGYARLPDVVRYLRAAERRLEALPRDVALDTALSARVTAVEEAVTALVAALPPARAAAPDVVDLRWQVEELRVSLFAQSLGTPRPVSEKRIFRAVDAIAP